MDKSLLLEDIFSAVGVDGQKYLCITRPWRFGKSVMANMVAAFLGKAADAVFHMSFITQEDKAGKWCVDKKAFFSQLTGSGIHRKESIKILHLQILGARY